MTVDQIIRQAESVLPGAVAPQGAEDPRWQAVIRVAEHAFDAPEPLFAFAVRWGSSADEDLRTTIATCLLEHLLEHHFEMLFPRVEVEVRDNPLFADCFAQCWPLGAAASPENMPRFESLKAAVNAI